MKPYGCWELGIVPDRLESPPRSMTSRKDRSAIEVDNRPFISAWRGASSVVMSPGRLISVTLPVLLSQEMPFHLQQLVSLDQLASRPPVSN